LEVRTKKTADKLERIRIFLHAGKSYDWITKELSVSKKTVADIKKGLL
jgi:transposase